MPLDIYDSINIVESVTVTLNPSLTIVGLGRIVLDGLTLTTDPETYEPLDWEKRSSSHQTLGGGVTIQDFGIFAKDDVIHLASGSKGLIDTYIAYTLHQKFRTLGATYILTDWMDNQFTVFISKFKAIPNIVGPLWIYNMELQVISIQKLFGIAYVGS